MDTIKPGPGKAIPKSPRSGFLKPLQEIPPFSRGFRSRLFSGRRPLSPAEKIGTISILLFFPLWPVSPLVAGIAPALFVAACAVFPFLPGASFFLPVISRGTSSQKAVGLTFDDGPDPAATPALLRLLEAHGAIATFFVTGRNARRHPEIIREILARGHCIGNHSYSHDNFIMFRHPRSIAAEIEATRRVFQNLGFSSDIFRPPVGITTPRVAEALRRTGLFAVTFSRRAKDMGNRRIRGLSSRILKGVRPNDILLLHDVLPRSPENLGLWLGEVEKVLTGIKTKGLEVIPLETLIGRRVMTLYPQAPR